MHLLGHPAYMSVNYPLEGDLYILKLT